MTLKDVSQYRHSRFSFVVIYELMHFQCNPLSFEHQWNISWTETNFKLISFMALWIVREGVKSFVYCKFSTWNDIFLPCFLVRTNPARTTVALPLVQILKHVNGCILEIKLLNKHSFGKMYLVKRNFFFRISPEIFHEIFNF